MGQVGKGIWGILSLSLSLSMSLACGGTSARAEDAVAPATASSVSTPPAPAAADGKTGKPDLISDGTRITVRDGELSIVPPRGWEVYTQLQGLTLLTQVPFQPGTKYQRTVQVASFSGPRYIDEVTAKDFEEIITRKFAAASSDIEGYLIRNSMTIEMQDGRQGLLFYAEFSLGGVKLMQAHILVSSADRHYLMTYTDLAEHFENDAANQFLTEAWDAMVSVQLTSSTPARFATVAYMAIAVGCLVLIALVAFGFSRWRSGRKYKDYANLGDGAFDTEPPQTLAQSVQIKMESRVGTRPTGTTGTGTGTGTGNLVNLDTARSQAAKSQVKSKTQPSLVTQASKVETKDGDDEDDDTGDDIDLAV